MRTSSLLGQFNVTQDQIYLNWTNDYASNITIVVNSSFPNVPIQVLNGSSVSVVTANYSQTNGFTNCGALYYLFVKNESGSYNNTIAPLAASSNKNITILDNVDFNHLNCSAGRYVAKNFIITNSTSIENVSMMVFVDVPISANNNQNLLTTRIGTFGTSYMPANASTYHSYYFDTSLIENATGVMINLTGWYSYQDLDLFLFDNSTPTPILKEKSINKTAAVESLLYNFLPSNEKMWEIRVYGNSSNSSISYNGVIVFTTLNATNSSNIQITSLDLGSMNNNNTKQLNFTLKNEGNLNLSNIVESKELYIVKRFGGNNIINFTFFVPDSSIVSRIKVMLNWTGSSNYTLYVYNQDESLVVNSTNKYVNANITGAVQEEYAETTSVTNGTWKAMVFNNTNVTFNSYNVTIYMYVSPTNWINSNYTTMNFISNGETNSTFDLGINLTIQNNTIDGLYEGYVQYLDGNRAGIRIPISFNVSTPMLIVNDSLKSKSITVSENYGTNSTITMDVYLNNSGSYDFSLTFTNSSNGTLSYVSGAGCSSGCYANFTYNSTDLIGSHSSKVIRTYITFNSSMPVGIYRGWIFFNATNSTTQFDSKPYNTFNLTLNLNLTNELRIGAVNIISSDGDRVTNGSVNENVTLKFNVYYINGTEITGDVLNISNFVVWLTGINITSKRIPSSGNLTLTKQTNPFYSTGVYSLNFTVPVNSPGEHYKVNILANYTPYNSSVPTYGGYSTNQTLIINSSGLLMSTNSTGCSFGTSLGCNPNTITLVNNTYTRIYVNISNYGPLAASSANITFNENCRYSVSYLGADCGSPSHGDGNGFSWFTVSPATYSSSCLIWWKITPSIAESSCTSGNITGDSSTNQWFNPNGINVTVTVTASTVSTTTSTATTALTDEGTTGSTGTTNRTTTALLYLDITSYPSTVSVEQGKNKTESIKVKNINTTITQNVKLEIFGIEDSSWYNISPSTYVSIANKSEYTFLVTFNIPKNTTVTDYPALFKTSSSYNYTKKNFVLKVTPGEETKTQITLNISTYKAQMLSLEKELNQSKKQGLNVSEAESLFNQLKQKITSADAYISLGDYNSAYDLLDDIKILINQTSSALKGSNKLDISKIFNFSWQNILKWGVIGGAVTGIAFFGYLFWPTPIEYKPETGFKTSKSGFGIKYKIIEILRKIKEKLNFRKGRGPTPPSIRR
jgi:hypothetical protein